MDGGFGLIVAILATWRVSHLVAREDGPFDLILRMRARAGHGVAGRLMDCPYCLSLWVAAPVATWWATSLGEGVLLWLAISGGACLVEMAHDAGRTLAGTAVVDVPPVRPDPDKRG